MKLDAAFSPLYATSVARGIDAVKINAPDFILHAELISVKNLPNAQYRREVVAASTALQPR